MRKAGIILLISSLAAVLIFSILVLSVWFGAFGRLHSKEDLLNYKGATASLVMSDQGEIIGRFFSENRTNVNYRQIPHHLIDALIATEDARFYDHRGIDVLSLIRVAFKTVLLNNRGSGGGSTISQQLAKNIFGRENYGFLSVPVSKIKESIVAYRIGSTFTKAEILTLYLNTVSFGENVYGIEAASRRYYNKKVEHLSIDESAVLVGILKANTLYNPRLYPENAISRRNVVLRQMGKYNFIQTTEADSLCGLPLALNYINLESVNPAGYFLVRVRKEAGDIVEKIHEETGREWNVEEDGLIINTTLNLKLQDYAIQSFHDHLPSKQKTLRNQYSGGAGEKWLDNIVQKEVQRLNLSERFDDTLFMRIFDWEGSYNKSVTVLDSLRQALTLLHAGMLAMDPSSGAIKSWIGGIDYKSQPYDQVPARRQMASAFKPILYAAALEEGIMPCRYYDNDSVVVKGYEDWVLTNYDHIYGGQYSVAAALSGSMNIPTFHLFMDVGFGPLNELWKDMGFTFTLNNTPSLAMGTAEASIIETAAAYSVFANGGNRTDPYSIESIIAPGGEVLYRREPNPHKTRVLSGRSAMLISAMLQKAVNEGTGTSMRSVYGVSLPMAGKTGTSQDYADAWFAGFNPALVIVSRAGASTSAIHFNSGAYGSGTALALPLVAMTMRAVENDRELSSQLSAPFPGLPEGLERALDCADYREKNIFDRFIDLFKNDIITFVEEDADTIPEKRSFLRRLFNR